MPYEYLKPTQYLPGQTGNPKGRPKKHPVTDHLEHQLDQPIPESLKSLIPVEMLAIFSKTPTFGEYMAFKLISQVIGKGDMFAAKEVLERVEGKVAQRSVHTGTISLERLITGGDDED